MLLEDNHSLFILEAAKPDGPFGTLLIRFALNQDLSLKWAKQWSLIFHIRHHPNFVDVFVLYFLLKHKNVFSCNRGNLKTYTNEVSVFREGLHICGLQPVLLLKYFVGNAQILFRAVCFHLFFSILFFPWKSFHMSYGRPTRALKLSRTMA